MQHPCRKMGDKVEDGFAKFRKSRPEIDDQND
jgi:hypothetical protein